MKKKRRWKGSDRADTHGRALIATDRWLDGRDISEAGLLEAMLDHLVGGHKALAEMVSYVVEQEPRGVGHPSEETFKGMLTRHATDYAQLIKRQMVAKRDIVKLNRRAANRAVTDLFKADPYYKIEHNPDKLELTIYDNLRNNR